MTRGLTVRTETWPIRGQFNIARGTKHDAVVVVAEISDDGWVGRGECVPYARYGETAASVFDAIAGLGQQIANGLTREELQSLLPPGAARNALDCALIDWEAKTTGRRAHEILGLPTPVPLATAFTLSLDSPQAMSEAASVAAAKGYRLLKLKIAGAGDVERVAAVRSAAPQARLIADANEGWSFDDMVRLTPILAGLGVALIEQPMKADEDKALAGFESPVPLCADESCHSREDLPRIAGRYSHINVKLDKAGGLTEALALTREAQSLGIKLMVGCMVSTSLAMAPASLLGQFADFVDLDGPLLLTDDREPGLRYDRDMLWPPAPDLWG